MELLAYWQIIRKRLLLILVIAAISTFAAAIVMTRQVPQYRTTTTLFLNPLASNPLLPFQITQPSQATAKTYSELISTRSFAVLVAESSGLPLTAPDVLRALSSQYVQDTQFFRITATHPDPMTAMVLANTAAETLIAQNAARNQAAQAQLEAQRSQNPQRQRQIELRDALREELDFYSDQIVNIRDQIAQIATGQASDANNPQLTRLRAELIDLQSSRMTTLNSLAQIESLLEAANSTIATTPSDTAVVVDLALLPELPVPSNLPRNLLLALLLGIGLGVALAFGLEYIDYTVRAPDALETIYGKPTLGVIATVNLQQPRIKGGPDPAYALTATDPRSPAAESVRSLRTSVQVASLNQPLNSLMVTSFGPGEGKTFVAANLAVSMAQYGQTVILVDLDLRKPNVHAIFGMPREPGFTNIVLGREAETLAAARPQIARLVQELHAHSGRGRMIVAAELKSGAPLTMVSLQRLIRRAEAAGPDLALLAAKLRAQIDQSEMLDQYLRPTKIPNLMVLPCGTIPAQPSELLGSPRAAQVMERLNEYADLVIYDTPPVSAITDAVILAPRVDGVLHVVRAGATRIDLIQRCQAMLEQAGANVLGPVLNQVKPSDLGAYSYYYYYAYGERQQGEHKGSRSERRLEQVPEQAVILAPPAHPERNGVNAHPPEHPERNGHGKH
ncbi:MAG: hypothetical protein AB4911_15710 [Oscillochloridaceae bacterium umkhey_bin13]